MFPKVVSDPKTFHKSYCSSIIIAMLLLLLSLYYYYSPISTLDGSKVRQVHDVARER